MFLIKKPATSLYPSVDLKNFKLKFDLIKAITLAEISRFLKVIYC